MARHARRANALICQRGTAHRRRSARRSSVFGNALGNAAASALNHASETQGPQQADTQSAANQYQGFANWLSGNDAGAGSDWQGPPYALPGTTGALAGTPGIAEPTSSGGLVLDPAQVEQILQASPQLVAVGSYATDAGVYGLPGDATTPATSALTPAQQQAIQMLKGLPAGADFLAPGETSSSTYQAYFGANGDLYEVTNPIDGLDGLQVSDGGVPMYQGSGVTVVPSAAELAAAQQSATPYLMLQPQFLPQSASARGMAFYSVLQQGPDVTALKGNPWFVSDTQASPGWRDTAGTGLGILSTLGDSSELASKQLHALYLGVDLGQDGAYTQALLATRGSVPLSAPLSGVAQTGEAAQAAAADANTVGVLVDFGKIEQVLGPIGILAGGISATLDLTQSIDNWGNGNYSQAIADAGHGLFTAGLIFVDPEVSVPLGLADLAVQHYSYQGQTGWTALWESMQASQQRLYQQNPTLYNQMWTGFKE